MPRLFIGNFDFEHRLGDPRFEPSDRLKRLNAELASSWLAIAEDGDYVWTPSPWDPDFLADAVQYGLPRVIPVTSFADVPQDVICVPWGWSHEIRELTKRFKWSATTPDEGAVRFANSRRMSNELERRWNVGLPGARSVHSLNDVEQAIESLKEPTASWIVKAEFGMSARERILGHGPLTVADANWVRRRLVTHGILFFEPWVERIKEFGIQIEIATNASPRLQGVTEMLVNNRGQYAGSRITGGDAATGLNEDLMSAAVEIALRTAAHLQQIGYSGPLGIDAMIYRGADGSQKVRPLQDINARWTMGRLSLGWQRLLRPSDVALWQHGSASDLNLPPGFTMTRVIETCPRFAAGTACQHQSRLLIQ